MKIFKPMSLEEAKKLYEELKQVEVRTRFITVAMDDIYFFTNSLTKDY